MSGKQSCELLPYFCINIDANWNDFRTAISQSLTCTKSSHEISDDIKKLWSTSSNRNFSLPCLSVRSGLDLYLQVKNFPPGSELIMSSINIPHMAQIVRHHGLRIVSLDISIDTLAPKVKLLPSLITSRTVAILVAHLYGKQIEMRPILKIAQKYKISVIEDCAECFKGLQNLNHSDCDLILYSFGPIKLFTSFGGGVVLIKDESIHQRMQELQNSYPVQSYSSYLTKVLKYFAIYKLLKSKRSVKLCIHALNSFGVEYQKYAVQLLRAFPGDLIENIRYQPSSALLSVMLYRQSSINEAELLQCRMKGNYVANRLPPELEAVGNMCEVNNYWLFPVLVKNPDTYVAAIKALGIDAYRGATQLNLIEGDDYCITDEITEDKKNPNLIYYPHEAKYLIDHVIYLPVHKHVPFTVLDELIKRAKLALRLDKPTSSNQIQPHILSNL